MKKVNETEMRQVEGGKYKCLEKGCGYSTGSLVFISFHTILNGHSGYDGKWGW